MVLVGDGEGEAVGLAEVAEEKQEVFLDAESFSAGFLPVDGSVFLRF